MSVTHCQCQSTDSVEQKELVVGTKHNEVSSTTQTTTEQRSLSSVLLGHRRCLVVIHQKVKVLPVD